MRVVRAGLAGLVLAVSTYAGCSSYGGMKAADGKIRQDPAAVRAERLGTASMQVQEAIAALPHDAGLASASLDAALASLGDEGILDDELCRVRAALDRDDDPFAYRKTLEGIVPALAERRLEYDAKVSRVPYVSKGVSATFFGLSLLAGLAALGYGLRSLLRKEE
jgi:hypothetical protein